MRMQAEAQDRMTVLRHGGAPPLEAESEGGRRRCVWNVPRFVLMSDVDFSR